MARAQHWYSKVLTALSRPDDAAKQLNSAKKVKGELLKKYSEFLHDDPDNEAAVYDQMLPMWILQTSGPLQQGGRKRGEQLPPTLG